MKYATLGKLGLAVFGLIFVSFLVRGFGQFVVGQGTALRLAAPIAFLAAVLAAGVVAFWLLARLGVTTLDEG
jgi:uncharacterized membrane protein YcjF (UPF0283 family)